MNPSAAHKGSSFVAVVRYVTHDIGAESAERVGLVEVLNMRTDDPEKAAKVMAWTALHAGELKAAAGTKATGRKTERPVYHFSLNWEPGASPTAAHMVDTAKAALAALGYERHEAVLATHTDKDHAHIHVVVNRIDPETGKTHNPKDDYEALQRWAYDYEKAHGRVVCLERALKYERDPALKAEYQQRLAAEAEAGQQRDSKSRPEWEAERDATHPKSQRYQELKATFVARARELARAGRKAATRRATEWEELRTRQADERAALATKHQAAFQLRRAFARTAKPEAGYSWKAFQADRTQLRKQQTQETAALKAQIKAKDAPAVAAFKDGQKAAWREFYRYERTEGRGKLVKNVAIVAATPVSRQGVQHRDHLARLFNATVTQGDREQQFGALLAAEKQAFYAGLAGQNAPSLTALKTTHEGQFKALQGRLAQARAAGKERTEQSEARRVVHRAEYAALRRDHRAQRDELSLRHGEEIGAQRQAWATLNSDRASAWDSYKQARAAQQAAAEKTPEKSRDSGDLYSNRQVTGRDYAQTRPTSGRDGGSRGDTGRQIAYKRSS